MILQNIVTPPSELSPFPWNWAILWTNLKQQGLRLWHINSGGYKYSVNSTLKTTKDWRKKLNIYMMFRAERLRFYQFSPNLSMGLIQSKSKYH